VDAFAEWFAWCLDELALACSVPSPCETVTAAAAAAAEAFFPARQRWIRHGKMRGGIVK